MKYPLLSILAVLAVPCGLQAGQQISSDLSEIEQDIGTIGASPGAAEEEKPKLRMIGSAGASYTSNAESLGSHGSSDLMWLPSFEIGYNVPLGRGFSLDSFLRADSVVYSTNLGRSFWSTTGAIYLDHRIKEKWPRLYVGGEGYHYQRYESNNHLTRGIAIRAGFDHGIAFNGDRTLFFYGYDFGRYWTYPSNDDRFTHRLTLGLLHQFNDKLFAQIFYSYQYSQFYRRGDDSHRNVIGLNFIYRIDDQWSTSFNTSYVHNDSERFQGDYEAFNAGVQVTFTY